jgi:hypothetical protein
MAESLSSSGINSTSKYRINLIIIVKTFNKELEVTQKLTIFPIVLKMEELFHQLGRKNIFLEEFISKTETFIRARFSALKFWM